MGMESEDMLVGGLPLVLSHKKGAQFQRATGHGPRSGSRVLLGGVIFDDASLARIAALLGLSARPPAQAPARDRLHPRW